MDGLEELNGVLVIGATNRIDMVDPALLRPGRFDRIVHVPNPNASARKNILRIHMRNKPFAKDVNLEKISEVASDMSGADLESIVNKAAVRALKRHISLTDKKSKLGVITQEDLVNSRPGAMAMSQKKIRMFTKYSRMTTSKRRKTLLHNGCVFNLLVT